MSNEDDFAKAQQICDWILNAPSDPNDAMKHESAVPVRVTIDGRSWVGSLYCLAQILEKKHRVVYEGPMHSGEWDRSYRLYLAGKRPYVKGGHLYVYDLPAEQRQPLERCYVPDTEWYVAAYWEKTGNMVMGETVERVHPFGPHFILSLHQSMNFGYYQGQKVDHYEGQKDIRHPMTVEYLTPTPSV